MKPWLKFSLIFLAGLLLGGAVTGFSFSCRFKHPPGLTKGNYEHILNRLSSQLKLTPDQREKAGALLQANIPKVEAVHKECGDKLEALRGSFGSHLRLLLDADQQKKLDELEAKWKKRAQDEQAGKN